MIFSATEMGLGVLKTIRIENENVLKEIKHFFDYFCFFDNFHFFPTQFIFIFFIRRHPFLLYSSILIHTININFHTFSSNVKHFQSNLKYHF